MLAIMDGAPNEAQTLTERGTEVFKSTARVSQNTTVNWSAVYMHCVVINIKRISLLKFASTWNLNHSHKFCNQTIQILCTEKNPNLNRRAYIFIIINCFLHIINKSEFYSARKRKVAKNAQKLNVEEWYTVVKGGGFAERIQEFNNPTSSQPVLHL